MSSIHLKYFILGIVIVLVAANIVWSAGSSRAQTKTNRSQSSKTSNSQSSKTSNSQSSKTSTRARNDVGNKTGWSKKLLGTMLLLLTLPGTLSPLNLAVASGTGGGGSLANGNGLVQYNNLLCEPYMEAGHKYLRCQTKLDNVDSQKKLDIYATNAKNRKRNWERIGKVDLKGCAMGKPKTGKNERKGKKQEETCEKSVQIRKEQVQKVMNMTNQISPAWRNIHLKHANNKRTKSIKPGGRRALLQADRQVSITVVNSCDYNTWPNLISGDSRFVGGNTPDSWAFPNLHKGDSYTVSMPANTAAVNLAIQMACNDDGTGCTSAACTDASGNSVRCPKGAGGSNPKTQIEWTFNGDKNQDFYDISLVNGQNVVAKVTPANGNCPSIAKCDLLAAANQLPAEMVVKDPNGYPYLVKGFCDAFPSDPSMCCTGAYGTSPACKPVFETPGGKAYQWWTAESSVCPHDYLYAYMDSAATYTCDNSQVQNPGYTVELCPAS